MESLNGCNSKGIRKDGRGSSICRAMTILIGSKGGFCDITKGQTRLIVYGFVSPSLILKRVLFSKICFSFRFFYQNLTNKSFSNFQKKLKNFLFLTYLTFPISNFLKNSCFQQKTLRLLSYKPKIEFKLGILENDGNLQDIMNCGIGMTINSLELPFVDFFGQSGIIKWNNNRSFYFRLERIFFFSNSFSIQTGLEENSLVLSDPTFLEEFNGDSQLSVSVVKRGYIKNITYGYESGLSEENLFNIYKISLKNYSFFGKLIKKLLVQKTKISTYKEIILIT
jgi:exosome complex RNA-binding protein Rrp42 (RNase PH superfamily)